MHKKENSQAGQKPAKSTDADLKEFPLLAIYRKVAWTTRKENIHGEPHGDADDVSATRWMQPMLRCRRVCRRSTE